MPIYTNCCDQTCENISYIKLKVEVSQKPNIKNAENSKNTRTKWSIYIL